MRLLRMVSTYRDSSDVFEVFTRQCSQQDYREKACMVKTRALKTKKVANELAAIHIVKRSLGLLRR